MKLLWEKSMPIHLKILTGKLQQKNVNYVNIFKSETEKNWTDNKNPPILQTAYFVKFIPKHCVNEQNICEENYKINLRGKITKYNTIGPWTVELQRFACMWIFSINAYYSTTQSIVVWIHRCITVSTEGQL